MTCWLQHLLYMEPSSYCYIKQTTMSSLKILPNIALSINHFPLIHPLMFTSLACTKFPDNIFELSHTSVFWVELLIIVYTITSWFPLNPFLPKNFILSIKNIQ